MNLKAREQNVSQANQTSRSIRDPNGDMSIVIPSDLSPLDTGTTLINPTFAADPRPPFLAKGGAPTYPRRRHPRLANPSAAISSLRIRKTSRHCLSPRTNEFHHPRSTELKTTISSTIMTPTTNCLAALQERTPRMGVSLSPSRILRAYPSPRLVRT
jgi:hypothetical protein